MKILHLYISEGHNYFGHHNKPPGTSTVEEVEEISLVEGKGIKGDRFFDYKEDYKGQVTFFSYETFLTLKEKFGVFDRGPEVFRRNIIVAEVDLNSLIGKNFEIQGVKFFGVEEARPCYWMEQAFCEGAEAALLGNGGLRARVLSSGVLKTDSVTA
ncbi:MAG: molybdenum cofactor biosysynthesis protein [Verrucomicrobiales bacterium]|nr:molybdenum cofactor biosysynthesis protein [Verrucomicrobiales bacterium]